MHSQPVSGRIDQNGIQVESQKLWKDIHHRGWILPNAVNVHIPGIQQAITGLAIPDRNGVTDYTPGAGESFLAGRLEAADRDTSEDYPEVHSPCTARYKRENGSARLFICLDRSWKL